MIHVNDLSDVLINEKKEKFEPIYSIILVVRSVLVIDISQVANLITHLMSMIFWHRLLPQ